MPALTPRPAASAYPVGLKTQLFLDLFDSTADTASIPDGKSTGQPWEVFGLGEPYLPHCELPEKQMAAIQTIKGLISEGNHLMCSCSWGKDSSVMLAIALEAMRQVVTEQECAPTMYVVTSSTLVENPVMDVYYRGEAAKLRTWIADLGLPVELAEASPSLSQNYLVSMIGGQTIASMPGQGSKCSVNLKVEPLKRLKNRLMKRAKNTGPVVSLIGKRWSESADRKAGMIEGGERPDLIVERNGERQIFPIAHFTEDDVFEFIALVRNDLIQTYSNFDDLIEVYRGAAGGECMVTAFTDGKAARTGCSARFGCHVCLRVQDDRSMENLSREHEWLKPLSYFRNYLGATHFDPARRCYLPRSINEDGTISLSPNTYSPDHCEDLLRFALTIQVREEEAAHRAGLAQPRFHLIGVRELLAIEVMWGRYGYHRALRATEIFKEIYEQGRRYDVPVVSRSDWHDRSELTRSAKRVPFVDEHFWDMTNGLRDMSAEMCIDEPTTVAGDGTIYANVNVGDEFDIDMEGAYLFLEYESDRAIAEIPRDFPAAGLFYLMRLGTVSIKKGAHSSYDRMIRIGNAIHRHGIRDCLNDPEEIARRLLASPSMLKSVPQLKGVQ